MGFGHAIYRASDPRNVIIKQWAEKLAAADNAVLYPVLAIEKLMWMKKNCLLMLTFFMHRSTTLWGFQPSCLRRFLFARGSLAGLPM